jgi:hypothetical protein
VSPRRTGSQQASGGGSAASSPEPGQRSPRGLWLIRRPSWRSGVIWAQAGHRPLPALPASRGMPRPAGGAYGWPATAAGHGGRIAPGKAPLASARTGAADRASRPARAGYQPSAAGRMIRVA